MKNSSIRRRALVAAVAGIVSLAAAAQTGSGESTVVDSVVAMLSEQAAEGFAGIEQQLKHLDPMLVKTAAPMVAALIADSRDEAIAYGVERIPAAIREELAGYVPDEILDLARWCSDCGGALSLQETTFRLGYSPAITLDYVIVFQRRAAALADPSLWAHELKHVMQYEDWGVAGFATKYLEDFEAVEREAAEFRWEWMKLTNFLERRKAEAMTGAVE